MADFYTILTNAGIAYETAAKAAGTPIKLAKMSVGDGGGAAYNPDATATGLKREVWRGDINALIQDKSNPNWLVAELVIPDDVGGWTVREAGIWTDTGILYAVIKYPESFKPILSTGAGKEFYVRAIFQTSNAPNVTLLVDESIVKATRAWVVDYVAAELAKLDWKKSVRAIATTPITLSGAQTVDAVALVTGDRALVAGQAAAKDNGIYIVANGPWLRADDANLSIEVSPNLFVLVEEGTAYGDSAWQLVTNGPIVLGTTALTFEMAFGRTGVAAGAYKQVSVDKYGRVVAGSNPTTLSGFGIQDAFTKTETAKAVTDAIAALVGNAPAAIDAIYELAAAINNDPNFAASVATQLGLKAPLASPNFTGDPRAPTAPLGDNDLSVANTSFVQTAVQAALRAFGIGSADNGSNTLDLNLAPWGSFVKVEGVESDAALYNRPVTGAAGNAPVCFDVLTFGLAGRTTQYATQLFAPGGRGRTFVRVQHDSSWFPWRESAMTDSPAFSGSPTAPTVPFNTESSQLANMQAIGDAKQGWRGVGIGYTASAVLNPTAMGRWHRVTVAGVTLTLPSKADVEVGKSLSIHNAANGPITIKTTNSEVIAQPGGGSTLTLAANEWVILAYNSDAIYLPGGRGKLAEVATIDSPTFTGDPRVPTAAVGDNDLTAANTAFVQAALAVFGMGALISPLSADLNVAVLGGFFRTNSTTANAPLPGNMSGCTVPYNNGGCLQIAALLSGNTASVRIYFRAQAGGVWSAWKEFGATDSPVFIGNPTGPTPAPGDNSKSLATTEFVRSVAGDMVGMVGMFAMSTPPDGWLKRNGAAVSRTTYAALFAKIGTLYGAGDGSTTFNLPDSRGYFDRAWDDARGIDPNRVLGSLQATQNQSHGHSGTALSAGAHSHNTTFVREMIESPTSTTGNAVLGDQLGDGYQYMTSDPAGAHTHILSIANSGGNESRPPNQAFLACIKY